MIMEVITRLRRSVFWIFDAFKGGLVRKHLMQIENVLNNFNSQQSLSIRNSNKEKIISHTINTVPFYKKLQKVNKLENFPVINKNIIRDNFKTFQSKSYLSKNNNIVSTSGSTGAPFQVIQNENKRQRNLADTVFFASRVGYEIGEQLIYIKIWSKSFGLKNLKGFLKNVTKHSVYKLGDTDISLLLNKINIRTKSLNMIAYASSFEKIANYLEKTNSRPLECKMNSMIAISERLNEFTKKAIEKYFGCQMVSRYSNNENGILAQQNLTHNDIFEVNWASYYIEMLDLNEDKPVPYGTIGRVIVTDFFNYAMPLIRYDTGDLAVMNIDERQVPFLERIEGRKLDMIYNTSGDIVSSHLAYHLCKYGTFKQFQIAQHGLKDYHINLNTTIKVEKESEMIDEYKGYLGQDANIKINYVDEIPILNSGKRQEVVNTYYNN